MPRQYPKDFRDRAVRLVTESREDHETEWAAIQIVASRLNVGAETLRKWMPRPIPEDDLLHHAAAVLKKTPACRGRTRHQGFDQSPLRTSQRNDTRHPNILFSTKQQG
jgi:hypothetical protein